MEDKLIDILQNFQNNKNYNELNAVDDILRLFNIVRKSSTPLMEGRTKSNVKKYNGVGRQAPPPPPVITIKGNIS